MTLVRLSLTKHLFDRPLARRYNWLGRFPLNAERSTRHFNFDASVHDAIATNHVATRPTHSCYGGPLCAFY